jgi:hypothetical protein
MKKILVFSLSIACILSTKNVLAQFKSSPAIKAAAAASATIPFTVAKNYFVKNTFKQGMLKNAKIESQAAFDEIFGMARTMGENGKPSAIDFSKQFVIAVIPPSTSNTHTISAISLNQTGKSITLKYAYKEGAKQTFTSQPMLLLIVDAKYKGTVSTIKS